MPDGHDRIPNGSLSADRMADERREAIYEHKDPARYAAAKQERENDNSLPTDPTQRKNLPMANGLLWYFPNALAAVAGLSKIGNDQHNPGQPMHWSRGKSSDHADTIIRHLIDAGKFDKDGVRHSVKMAWRALALLQEELEEAYGLPLPRNAKAA